MHRSTLEILRCPKCAAGSLVPDEPVAAPAMIFGPVRCLGCSARYPVHEGLIDFVGERAQPSALQQVLELPWVARSWERTVRPALSAVLTRGALDRESEYTVLHSMIGRPPGPVVDLGCGTGSFTRRLATDFAEEGVIGVDVSRPMAEEAMAQLREHGLAADLVRAEVPPLPFGDHSLGAVVSAGLLHFLPDLGALLGEAARVLKPRGRFVASTFDAPDATRGLHQKAGLFPRHEGELRDAATKAGLVRVERLVVGPVLVWKAELP